MGAERLLERVAELKSRKYAPGALSGYTFLETEGGRFGYMCTPAAHDDSLLFSVYWELYARITKAFCYEELRKTGKPEYKDYREDYVIRVVRYLEDTDEGILMVYDVYSTILAQIVRVEEVENFMRIVEMWDDDDYLREVGRKAFDGVELYECDANGVMTRV